MPKKNPAKRTKETADLDRAIVVRSKSGEIRRIKSTVRLSTQDGSMVQVIKARKAWKNSPAQDPVYIPSAAGYKAISAKVGLAFDYPKTIIVDGKEQPNGYKDDDGTYYFVTRVGGYTANGQPVIVQRLVDYNVGRYNIQDLLAKAKIKEQAKHFKVLPFRGKDEKTGQLIGGPPEGEWAGYRVDDAVVLWVNCEAPEFVRWLGEMNNRHKNAVRTCQTFSERNAIAAHPAMPIKRKFAIGEAVVDCTSWVAAKGTINMRQLEQSQDVEIDEAAISITEDEDQVAAVRADAAAEPLHETDAADVEAQDDEEDDLPYDEPKEREIEQSVTESDPQKEELIKTILEFKKYKGHTFKKACEMTDVDPSDLDSADMSALIEIHHLIKASMNSTGAGDTSTSEE